MAKQTAKVRQAPAPQPPPEAEAERIIPPPQKTIEVGDDPAAGLRGGPAIAVPVPLLADGPEAVINNVLCREIQDPTQGFAESPPDPNITVLDEISRGISQGTDINHVKEDAMRIAAHQTEKASMVRALMRGVDINRLNRFVRVRDKAEQELSKAAMRGDLKSTEYLAFLRMSALEIKEIMVNLSSDELHKSAGSDSAGMLAKMDHTQQAQETASAREYKGTTPQGREIIRKQIYDMKTLLRKAGKLKPAGTVVEHPQKPEAKNGSKPKSRKSKHA